MFKKEIIFKSRILSIPLITILITFGSPCFSSNPQKDLKIYEDVDTEYKNHQNVVNDLFKKNITDPTLIKRINDFKEQYSYSPKVDPICLDGLSSYARILLFRSISEAVVEKWLEEENSVTEQYSYFKVRDDSKAQSKEIINYKLDRLDFGVFYNPTKEQPGNLAMSGFLTFKEIGDYYETLSPDDHKIAVSNFHFSHSNFILDNDDELRKIILILHFEFEIARRLVGTDNNNEYDQVPVAAAIIKFFELAQQNSKFRMKSLFYKDLNLSVPSRSRYGSMFTDRPNKLYYKPEQFEQDPDSLSPFKGIAKVREWSVFRILYHGLKMNNYKPETQKEIEEKYKKFFGIEEINTTTSTTNSNPVFPESQQAQSITTKPSTSLSTLSKGREENN